MRLVHIKMNTMDRRTLFTVFFYFIFQNMDLARSDCNQKYVVKSGDVVEVVSQNYPNNYSRNAHCFYDFTTEFNSGVVIHVHVLEVTLSCKDNQSRLEVYDAFNTSPRYLGRICKGGDVMFVSPKERMYLVFESGGRGPTSMGFKLKVEGVPEFSHCYKERAKVLNVLHETQQLVTPYYPFEVAPNVHCRWLLKAPQGHKVTVEILHADMKGSSDCSNFGLYIFDGKTTYDDERVAQVCDTPLGERRSFDSSTNYLLVVFSSGPHVLYSGGGVRLTFYSSLSDRTSGDRDHTLLFILVGVLLGIASFTIVMIIVRFFVVPARRKALSRDQGRRSSRAPLRSISAISTTAEPPPPYRASEEGTTNRGFVGVISNMFKPHGENVRHNFRGVTNSAFDAYDFGPIPPQADANSINNVINLCNSGVLSPEILRLSTGVLTHNAQLSNDYRELTNMTNLRLASGRRDSGHYETVSGAFSYLDAYPDTENDSGSIHLSSDTHSVNERSQLPAYETLDSNHAINNDEGPALISKTGYGVVGQENENSGSKTTTSAGHRSTPRTNQKRERIPTPDEANQMSRPWSDVSTLIRKDNPCRPDNNRNETNGSNRAGSGSHVKIDGIRNGSVSSTVDRLEVSKNSHATSGGENSGSSAAADNQSKCNSTNITRLGHHDNGASGKDAGRGYVDADGYEIPTSHYDKPNILNTDEDPEYQTLHYDIVQL